MFQYAIRRTLFMIPMLLLLATLTFFLMRLAPGGPFDSEQVWPPEIQANIAHKYELDRPLAVQFFHWLGDVAHGDLRDSFQYMGYPVSTIIRESLPASLLLGGWALVFAVLGGIPLGCIAAWKHRQPLDHVILFISASGLSLPSYLVASILILIFSIQLNWLPPALWESPSSMIMPVITLGFRPLAIIASLTRISVLEALSQDYIRTAYGKGLSTTRVIFKHALKNSMIPVITVMGPIAANLITGSFLVESVFQIPGMGKHFVQAVLNRDYPLVMGVTLIYGVILISSNILVDLLYGWVDPRIRMGS
jgi:oligopeptide transport system permease protein